MRRSSRLQQDPEPSVTPPTPSSSEDDEVSPVEIDDLPDMGPRVEIYDLPDTEIGFDAEYLASQEQQRPYYSSEEEFLQDANSDCDSENIGGIEAILWPPEVMLQARHYGRRGRKRRSGVQIEREEERVDGACLDLERSGGPACGVEGASSSHTGGAVRVPGHLGLDVIDQLGNGIIAGASHGHPLSNGQQLGTDFIAGAIGTSYAPNGQHDGVIASAANCSQLGLDEPNGSQLGTANGSQLDLNAPRQPARAPLAAERAWLEGPNTGSFNDAIGDFRHVIPAVVRDDWPHDQPLFGSDHSDGFELGEGDHNFDMEHI